MAPPVMHTEITDMAPLLDEDEDEGNILLSGG